MIFLKRAVSPVVATALLLVVAVSAVVGFSSWINEFNSNLFVDVESDSSSSSSVRVEGIFNDVLYLKSSSDVDLSSLLVYSSNGSLACDFSSEVKVSNDGLVGHWDFSNTNDGIIHDLSGNGNDGKLYGDTNLLLDLDDDYKDKTNYNHTESSIGNVSCDVLGITGNGCYFDGNNNRISYSNNNEFSNESFSLSFWINPISPVCGGGGACGVIKGFLGNGYDSGFRISNNNGNTNLDLTLIINSTGNRVYFNIDSYNIGNWTNYILTYNSQNYDIGLYIDSILINTYNYGGPIFYNPSEGSDFRLGQCNGCSGFNGTIDEVGIYNKVLSLTEISNLYNSRKVVFIEFVDSPTDKAVEFDGKDDYIIVPYSNSLAIENNLSFYVKFKSLSYIPVDSYSSVFRMSSGTDSGYTLRYSNLLPIVGFRIANLSFNSNELLSKDIPLNSWEQITGIMDGLSVNLSQNNLIVSSSNLNLDSMDFSTFPDLVFGANSALNDPFYGQIDEIRIYNRTLSREEIEKLYWNSVNSQSIGINKVDLSSCNLISGDAYNIVGFTDSSKIDVEVIPQ